MEKIAPIVLGILVLVISSPLSFAGMNAEEVIHNLKQSYEKQMEDIKDMTMVTNTHTTYQKKARLEGKTVYKTRSEMGNITTIYDGVYQWTTSPLTGKITKHKISRNPEQFWKNLNPENARYLGIEKVGGKKAHVLEILDMSKVMGQKLAPGQTGATGKIWVDAANWIFLKYHIRAKIKGPQGQESAMITSVEVKDYRKIKGMFIPYKTVMTTRMDMPGLTSEQKKMMQAYGAGGTTTEVEVKEVKINTGLSDSLFDGSKLKASPSPPPRIYTTPQ